MRLRAPLIAILLLLAPAGAFADVTLFVGTATTPSNRAVKGFAVGTSLLVVGAEFEWSSAGTIVEAGAPALRTGSGNVYLQTPAAIVGIRPYLTTGFGRYAERLADDQITGWVANTGAGARVSLLGPVHVRIDYRVFRLRGSPRFPTVHRGYIGLNVSF